MNTKYLLAVGAIVTSLTLGACGNSNSESDHANHKDKQQEDSNVKTDTTYMTSKFLSDFFLLNKFLN